MQGLTTKLLLSGFFLSSDRIKQIALCLLGQPS
ncbi:hypothetical protein EPIR_1812 [Erwinia piriflorinigrans CFBP 5888]|uniref:Uncharacterized protein n=1 Tax=Erwinia piriflorinigrans CFBP 5888 TaxID=1161919 RepID=V5Z773_9GAMM|nr:hypothetical protein EPIR_1812 [Erwinia piriflorinigrans CFBP 5888]